MSVYHYVVGQHPTHALPMGKNPLWHELEGKEFKTRDDLYAAVRDIETRSSYSGSRDESPVEFHNWISAIVDDLMEVQPPFRVFNNDSRRSNGGGYSIMESRTNRDAAKPGSWLGDHLFGLSPEDY